MSKYPPKEIAKAFKHALRRGAIIRTKIGFSDGSRRIKYLIILNKDLSLDIIYFFTTYSKIDFFNNNQRFEPDIIRIPRRKISCFYRDTIIDCRQEHKLTRKKLWKRFQEEELKLEEYYLPNNYLNKLNEVIRNSSLLSDKIKKIIDP